MEDRHKLHTYSGLEEAQEDLGIVRVENPIQSSKSAIGIEEKQGATERSARWTKHESLVLVHSVRCFRDETNKATNQGRVKKVREKWGCVARKCAVEGVIRDSSQCKKRWNLLVTDYKKIRNWLAQNGIRSYWVMNSQERKNEALPAIFDMEIYASISEFMGHQMGDAPKSVFDSAAGEESEDVLAQSPSHDACATVGAVSNQPNPSTGQRKRRRNFHKDSFNDRLVDVFEESTRAMERTSELDRMQRENQSKELVSVLGKMAEALGMLAQRL